MISFEQYSTEALKTRNQALNWEDNLLHSLLMLSSEVGELCGAYQKALYQGHPIPDPEVIILEVGDVLWALNNLAALLGYDLDEVAEINILKLRKRFNDGSFSIEDSINRVDVL